eukprot:CAMPEP_0204568170 /NCGR_PEP_ID=MMETSP0661-20131031/37029_1 /ASSEMBLY_ACC=CAM_ASM_000606 /TAXON_ID=109239 /ORGANISM="Alexandrium margalefi, Strain AMGDE01CS-322" /LENGTH=48 /DNA_ID= /DNA_START= /DNA_END= /DNA_ORIENTATION=
MATEGGPRRLRRESAGVAWGGALNAWSSGGGSAAARHPDPLPEPFSPA